MKKWIFGLCAFALLQGCGGSSSSKKVVRLGVDDSWYPIDFGAQTAYVNGFVEELLVRIAEESDLQFEYIRANSDMLYELLGKKGSYTAVLGSLPPYDYYKDLYAFSANFLPLGPVLIVSQKNPADSLAKMEGQVIGTLVNDPAALLLHSYAKIISHSTYTSIPELFSSVESGEIDGALLNCVPAAQYLNDLFPSLKIATEPLTSAGLHLVACKGDGIVSQFNKELQLLEKKKRLQKLKKKWGLRAVSL